KTTLLAMLLDRMREGGILAGSAVARGKAVIVSEEDALLWESRSQRFQLGDHVYWLCRPFRAKPTPAEWIALIDALADHRRGRRRRLRGFSRDEETPRGRVIALSAEGTDYVSHGDFEEEYFVRGWPVLRRVLTEARNKQTRRELLDVWAPDHERPGEVTLWRW